MTYEGPDSRSEHDPEDRRVSPRICAPMTVVIGNTPYAIQNWSLGGMKIANYYGPLQPPDKADVRVLVPTAGPGPCFRPRLRSSATIQATYRCRSASKDWTCWPGRR